MGRPKGSKNKTQEEEVVPSGTISEQVPVIAEKPVVKKELPPEEGAYKTNDRWLSRDHTPLCINCGHREEMHHTWRHIERSRLVRNYLSGKNQEEKYVDKEKVYDSQRPCQHACKCTDWK